MFSKLSWILIIVTLIITRFCGFNWGGSYLFNPDENNMAVAVSQFSINNFDPHFYSYGQFPLYLAYFSEKVFGVYPTVVNSTYILRLWSAIFSCLSILILYLLFPNKLFLLLLIFTPGLIQIAHFGTTESLLLLVFCLNLYFATTQKYFLAAIISGIGIATKVSAVIFIIPIIFTLTINKKFIKLFLFLLMTFAVSCLLSPYNLINFPDFLSAFRYETSVANGTLAVFYTRQFVGTLPYLFQFTHIFPYIAGLPMFVITLLSIFFTNKSFLIRHKILIISCLIYFLYFGQVFVKWTRFMSPLFFLFPLLTAVTISKIKFKPLYFSLILFSITPGLLFLSQYFMPDVRVVASDWMNQNIPVQSAILSESGNVVNLPLNSSVSGVINYDFYQKPAPNVVPYDYIFVPSRRVFKNNFAPQYYQQLFSGSAGFTLIKQFSPVPNLFLNDENAEETWTVFDRPTVRIFQKTSEI